jgi:hypothetical protein
MVSRLLPLNLAGLSICPDLGARTIAITMIGNADMEAHNGLASYLEDVHAEALAIRSQEVVVDLRQLYFLSSSCMKAFVAWLTTVEGCPATSRYRIRIISNPRLEWQRRSLDALAAFAAGAAVVEA